MTYRFEMLDGEYFWGGSVTEGKKNPFGKNSDFTADYREECINQVMPLFLSNKGRYIWSENPFKIEFKNGTITVEGEGVLLYSAGETLKDAYLCAMQKHFPCNGRILPEKFFSAPQFNTWMEFVYEPTQEGILKYAQDIIDNGFEPGVLIIDEGWQKQYGKWEFDDKKFPNPKEMTDKLHKMGFCVLLWVVPWVRADGYDFVMSTNKIIPGSHKDADKLFLRDAEDNFAMMRWWNGISAILDMRKECDRSFMEEQLTKLMSKYGIDGFKFDGANICYGGYQLCSLVNGKPHESHNPHELNIAWNEFGRKYEYHEFKDTYKGGGKNSISRLCDCSHEWVGGADILVPNTVMQGLIGHPFGCPDMVAGGSWIYSADKD
ncbi:MAG: glycoside hydrolase, partial [Clostridia bacterium]|nr:glycoside hydrolase [Clostridia bacterium]